jgi:hypothetical protein
MRDSAPQADTHASSHSAGAPAGRAGASSGASGADRRRNAALRELIDEMLVSIRVATNRELWSADERADYERQLAEIMTRVRREALHRERAG